MSRIRSVAAAAAAISLAAIGCGSSSSGKPLTHAELVAKADAICKRANTERDAIGNSVSIDYGKLSAEELKAFEELSTLKAPASLAADWKQILLDDKTLVQDTSTLAAFVGNHDVRGARGTVRAAASVQRQMGLTAERNGFKDCAQFA